MAMGEPLDKEDIVHIVKSLLKDNLTIEIKHDVKSEYFGCNIGSKDINIININILLDDEIITSDNFSFDCAS